MNIIKLIKIILKWLMIYLFVGMICFIFVYFSRYDELLIDTLLPRIISECKLNMKHEKL
jgi:hypothetical protein